MREKKFDIVITDMSMPGMGGAELIDHIKKLNSDVLIAAMSGWVGNLDREASSKADYTLLKPFTIEDLEKMLYKLQEYKKTLAV
jgi:two-component system response regulator (stage 0 sporulation protein F)